MAIDTVTSPRPHPAVDEVDVGARSTSGPLDPVLSTDRPHTTYLIGRLDRIVRRALEARLRPHGVTLLGYTALTVLAARPGLSNAQLARRSFMTPQGMNQAVAVLAERGLIRRSPDASNRRKRRIELTELGRRTVDVCSASVEEYEQTMLESLDVDQRHMLNELLRAVVDANRERSGPARPPTPRSSTAE